MIYKLDLNISSKCICYDEGLTLKKSSLKLFTVAKLCISTQLIITTNYLNRTNLILLLYNNFNMW